MINLSKSIFISAYSSYVVIAAVTAVVAALSDPGRGSVAWAGAALVHLPIALLLARLMLLKDTPRTHPLLPLVSTLTIAGLVLTIGAAVSSLPTADAKPLIWAVSGTLGYAGYLFWYSRFRRAPSALLAPGKKLPRLQFETVDGEGFDSAELAGGPAVLIFYRGNWCPLCVAQIREIAAQYRDLAARGVEVLLISPQPQRKSQRLARQFDAPMRFLVDRDNRAARQLDLEWRHGLPAGMQALGYDSDTVLPTIVVVDANGTIVFADQTDNYRVRPDPGAFIAALDAGI